ncbi:ATP-binding protein [Vibrio diabolicus]|uniref:ATP-binding protein n=1 Tax=Vibrio diabolicus TaxID=50719 RepID=UPI0015F5530F|nr:ATP-binding protein [Vibrio diabolicus]
MQLKLEGAKEHKGFQLQNTITLDESILVLTGKNGSGKTRLLESMQNGSTVVKLNDKIITNQNITLVSQSSLTPNFGQNYNDAQFQRKITATLQLFDLIKSELDLPYEQQKNQPYNIDREEGLTHESLFKLCLSIANKTGKPASELTHEDIILHFEEPSRNVLGVQSISTIVNQYIKRRHKNEFNEWKNTQKGVDVQYFSEQDFLNQFGEKPWLIINRILNDTFDGKFQFCIPDEESQSYTYQAQLLQGKEQTPVTVEHLSSGEKTLLWLALTLFNSQYYEFDIAHTPKVLLIDEPDAFLHPKMVLKMYQSLKSFNCNFGSLVVISTHSPTTVALAPSENVYLVESDFINCIEKDSAISELLDGVTQISLNPKNRRQVFVESQYDVDVYQCIYSKLAHNSSLIDSKISLSFVSSGPKMPKQQITDKVKQVLGVTDEPKISEFIESLNGIGNCVQVVGQVEALVSNENGSVRGIIDWDLKNAPSKGVSVLAQGYAYSIENVTLDPICILLLLHIDKASCFTMSDICGSDVNWSEWLEDKTLLQESVDRYIHKILGRKSKKDSTLSYVSGVELLTDSEYLRTNGHDLEELVKTKYPALNAYCRNRKDGELKSAIVSKSMINLTNGKFIPSVYEYVLADVQK